MKKLEEKARQKLGEGKMKRKNRRRKNEKEKLGEGKMKRKSSKISGEEKAPKNCRYYHLWEFHKLL